MTWAAAGLALAGVGAVGQVQGGYAQAKGLAAQATMVRTQAKSEALKYKQQGVAVLDNILRTDAAINARAAAGGIDPFSGSAGALSQYAMSKGAGQYYTTEEGAMIQLRIGELAANQLMAQGRQAIRSGWFGAATTLGTAAIAYNSLGKPPSTGTTPITTPTPSPTSAPVASYRPISFV
jgi:hypothetical protein